jgi:glycerophosphoryl diester phosphodiesterase
VTVAHGAGNDLRHAARAAAAGADVIEADVHAYRGRVEVRHLKTLGRLPLLWDRWYLAPGWRPRFLLPELVAALVAEPGPAIMLDLKGDDLSLADTALAAASDIRQRRRVLISGQSWAQIDRIVDAPGIEVLYSVGRAEQLARVWSHPGIRRARGVSIHRKFLSPGLVTRLKERVPFVMTWPINDEATLQSVAAAGVDAVTTDSLAVIERIAMVRAHKGNPAGGRAEAERA